MQPVVVVALATALATAVHGYYGTGGPDIHSIMAGAASPLADAGPGSYTPPGPKGSAACQQDTCCAWWYVARDMQSAFEGCTDLARGAVRLGFHDAAVWNTSLGAGAGGADGSILLSADELARSENRGLQNIAAQMLAWSDAYGSALSKADMIQLGAAVATVSCPGGPLIRTFVGRRDAAAGSPALPPPPGLLPSPLQDVPSLLDLFAAKTLSAADLVALVGAHTISRQFFFDPATAGAPQDTTDGVWDTTYYSQTAAQKAPQGVTRFPSDVALAHDNATRGIWQGFTGSRGGQAAWNAAYAFAFFRLGLLGVDNLDSLTDCTAVLPRSI